MKKKALRIMVNVFACLTFLFVVSAYLPTIVAEGSSEVNIESTPASDFVYTVYSDHVEITDYNGSAADVIIPRSIKGLPVTSIGNRTFYSCENLTSITIPDSVTSIGDYAFAYCDSLTSITIPDSVTSIGDYAFNGSTNLTSITIPASVTSIGSAAFNGCKSLDNITIPDSVTSIGDYAFTYCESLTSITIPDSVTSIGDYAFAYCNSLASITIPDSVTSIGDDAFEHCSNLTSITIPDSVTSIGAYAFLDCYNLTSITIPNSVTSIGGCAFEHCSNLTSITIPDSVTTIGDSAFAYCDSLTSIIVPDSVTNMGDSVFSHCYRLSSVTIPDGITSIGKSTFYDCDSLTGITIPDSVTTIGDYAFAYCDSLISVTIPDSVTSIGEHVFFYCKRLTSITIPDSVTSIGGYAFTRCRKLTSITIPDNVTSIGDSVFYYCDSLTSITIPDSVTSIGDYAFYNCDSLTGVTIPDSVTSVGKGAFYGCDKLASVTIGNGITKISNEAFCYCYNLVSIIISDSVTNIGDFAFENCWKLTEVTIPASVTSIGNDAFAYCDSLTISCYKNSFAHDYAVNNDIPYEILLPSVPENLRMTSHTDSTITLGWETSAGADGYVIEQLIDGKWQRVAKLYKQTNSRCTVTGLELGEYSFRIKAYAMVDGRGVFSTASEAISASTKLGKTEGEMSAYTTDSVTLSWVAVPGADGYVIEQYVGGGAWTQVADITSGTTVKYKLSSLDAATVYKYRIKAYKVNGDKTIYGTGCSTITAVTKPGITTGKMTAHTASSVTLSWDKVAGANGYIIEQYEGGGVWTQVAKVTSGSTVAKTISALESGTFYKYRIKAYRTVGETTYIGTGCSTITAMTKPAKTVGSVVTTTADSATLKWETVQGADGYVIEVYVGGGVWERAAKVTGAATSQYILTGLTAKTTYKYRIKAYKFLGIKEYFATGCDTISARTK